MKINSSVRVLSIFFGFFCHLLAQANPTVLSTTPVHNVSNAAPNVSITATFDAAMDPSTFTNSTIRVNGSISGLHPGTFSYNSSSFTATVVPNQPFKAGEIVTVALTRGIKSAVGDSLANSFLWSFLIKGGISSGLFEQVSSVSVGSDPYLAVAADLNGDGSPDLVTVNNYSNSVSLLKNNGNGTFTLDSTLGVGSYPDDIVAADFDGDGAIDLAVSGGQSNSVLIFKNNGHGVFTYDTTYNFGSMVWGLVAADFDGDGAIDLAVNNTNSNSVVILKNNGNGKFTQSSTVSVGSSPRYILARDFDNDGAIDLAVLNFNSTNVSILKNNGKGVFTQTSTVNVGSNPWEMAAGDFYGNGSIDLAVTNSGSNTISVLKNDGTGTFTLANTLSAGTYPVGIAAVDVNGDGYLDIVYGSDSDSILSIWKNNGSGTFSLSAPMTVSGQVRAITSLDADNDGVLELAVTDNRNGAVLILKARPQKASMRLSASSLSFGPVAKGLNKSLFLKIYNDGTDSSLVVGNITSSDSVFRVNRTTLTIAPSSYDSVMVTFFPVAAGLVYNDSLTIYSNDTSKQTMVVSVSGAGTFGVLSTTPVHNVTNAAPNVSITATFDAAMDPSTFTNSTIRVNGSISGLHPGTFSYNSSSFTATVVPNQPFKAGEMVTVALTRGIKSAVGDSLTNSFLWSFLIKGGSSSGLFEQVSSVSVGSDPFLTVAADLNGDGSPDLAAVNNYSNSVSLLKNNGNGTFTLDSTLGVGSYPNDVVAADFDGDGAIDLAVTESYSYSVSIFKNNGHGVFTHDTTYNLGSMPGGLVAADFDGDGAIDLAVSNAGSNSVTILKNNGNGKFTQSSTVNVGSLPRYILARDFDNDGAIDLAVLNFNSMSVSILKNNGKGVFTQTSTVNVGSNPWMMAAGDFYGNGSIDLAVTNSGSNTISVLKNDGTGTFTLANTLSAGTYPVGIAAVDVNGDGYLDIVYGSASDGILSIWKNNGSGTFSLSAPVTVSGVARAITSLDADNDGVLELAVTDNQNNTVSILKARPQKASMRLSASSLSFGPVAKGLNKSLYLKIYNDGTDSSLIVNNITSSDSVFRVNRTTLTIAPSSYDSVLVTFSPAAAGLLYNYNDTLMIASNDSLKPVVKVSVKAVPICIWDVPQDNGKQVYIKWVTMGLPGTFGVTRFGIFRYDAPAWTDIFEISVLTDSIYQVIVPTLVDSTGTNLNYWSTFKVIAYKQDSSNYVTIGPDSGYSVMNISEGINRGNLDVPKSFNLFQNYPNPFNPSTTIRYDLPFRSRVKIQIFNILGQLVAEVVNGEQAAGYRSFVWNANVASGIYFYKIEAIDVVNPNDRFVNTKKMILLK